MKVSVGDWLVVHSHTLGMPDRRGQIIAVGADGQPPYTVKWTDRDHEVMVFPGSDAQVLTSAKEAELARSRMEQLERTQAAIIQQSP